MKVISLFSGIGAFEKGLTNLGIEHEVIHYCEVDKYAAKAYSLIHGVDESRNLGDITKVNIEGLPKDIDLITHGSPCQDFSIAGKGLGADGGTRSSLMWNSVEIIRHCKPKFVIWENVKNVLSKKHKHNFDKYINELETMGYTNLYQVLNAKHYGIPQNRERIFCISILGNHNSFVFPEPFDNGLRLKDLLDRVVDEKFYVSSDRVEKIIHSAFTQERLRIQDGDVCSTLLARDYKDPKLVKVEPVRIGNIYGEDKGTGFAGNVWSSDAISPTLTTMQGGNRQPMVIVDNLKTPNIHMINLPQKVTVRKHDVDIEKLKKLLRTHKNMSNRVIAEHLNKPTTLVDHWFRNDKSFAIPCADTWYQLKELLGIVTDEFDAAITEFVERDGVYDKSNRVYLDSGISPTLTTTTCNEKVLVREANKKGYSAATIGDAINIEQPNSTTRRGRVGHGVAQTLNTGCHQVTLTEDFRIRRLTPLECWRLMGFGDEDFYKVHSTGISNTQLYKMAGNSIVVNVLMEIYKNLFF